MNELNTTKKEIEKMIDEFKEMATGYSCNSCNALEVIIKKLKILFEIEK